MEIIFTLGTLFWFWMVIDCLQNDPERQTWIWVLLFLNVVGALIYFFLRRSRSMRILPPRLFGRWLHRDRIWQLEADARNIGKAHQFVLLGNHLSEYEMYDRAYEAYKTALTKEPSNQQALWGLAFIDLNRNKFESARAYLETLLKLDPAYKYGDASLAFGKVLMALAETEAAATHLEKHIKSFSQPEAYLMLATIKADRGATDEAIALLDTMQIKVKGGTPFSYRQNQHLIGKAERILRNLRRR